MRRNLQLKKTLIIKENHLNDRVIGIALLNIILHPK